VSSQQDLPDQDSSTDEQSSGQSGRLDDADDSDSDTETEDDVTVTDALKEPSEYTKPPSQSVAKLYLGSGASIKGWIPMPKEVVEEAIAPLVLRHRMKKDEGEGIQVNSSKNVDGISGWDYVDEDVVLDEIESLVRKYRFD